MYIYIYTHTRELCPCSQIARSHYSVKEGTVLKKESRLSAASWTQTIEFNLADCVRGYTS